jgi:IS30 family transposase
MQEIAIELQKHLSTLYRELSRNKINGDYVSGRAQTISEQRRLNSKPQPKQLEIAMSGEVLKRLRNNHSPEQISGRLIIDFPFDTTVHASTETIYQFAYNHIQNGNSDVKIALRHGQKIRRNRLNSKEKRGSIPNRVMIDHRPAEVETKATFGHWEGDTVEGAGKSGYIATFTERRTKLLMAYPIPNKSADQLNMAAGILFRKLPAKFKKTLTLDNGKEFTHHRDLARITRCSIFFAHPYHSWERGLNEHTGICQHRSRGFLKGFESSRCI